MRIEKRADGWWVLTGKVNGREAHALITQSGGDWPENHLCEGAAALGELASAEALEKAEREKRDDGFLFPIGALVRLRAEVAERKPLARTFVVVEQILARAADGVVRWYRIGGSAVGDLDAREIELEAVP